MAGMSWQGPVEGSTSTDACETQEFAEQLGELVG